MTNINRKPELPGASNQDNVDAPKPLTSKEVNADNVAEILKAMRAEIGITEQPRVPVRRARMFN